MKNKTQSQKTEVRNQKPEYEAIGCSICDPRGNTVLIAPHDFSSKGKTARDIAAEVADKLNHHDALIAATKNLLAMFIESHQVEIETNHQGDGPKGCTYCAAIQQAQEALKLAKGEAI